MVFMQGIRLVRKPSKTGKVNKMKGILNKEEQYNEAQEEVIAEIAKGEGVTVEVIKRWIQGHHNTVEAKLSVNKLNKLQRAEHDEVSDLAGKDPEAAALLLNKFVKRINRDNNKLPNIVKRNRLHDALEDIAELMVQYKAPSDHYIFKDIMPLLKRVITTTTRI